MPSTRKQKAKARKLRELDMLSDYGNLDVMLGERNSNSIERELDSLINAPEGQQDFQSFPNRENSSQENEIRNIDSRNEPVRESRLMESINMLSGEMNARMPREMEAMMDLMQSQISRAISSAISKRIIPEIQNMVENLPLNQHDVEPCTSTNEEGIRNAWKNTNTRLTKKDSRSACDLREHTDNSPYTTEEAEVENKSFIWKRPTRILKTALLSLRCSADFGRSRLVKTCKTCHRIVDDFQAALHVRFLARIILERSKFQVLLTVNVLNQLRSLQHSLAVRSNFISLIARVIYTPNKYLFFNFSAFSRILSPHSKLW